MTAQPQRFEFEFRPVMRLLSLPAGVLPATAHIDVSDELDIRFGPWRLRTPLDNVCGALRTGPYALWKVAGGARLSFADRGVTFATTTSGGVCICFKAPVSALMPGGVLRHPAVTVTVARPDALIEALQASGHFA